MIRKKLGVVGAALLAAMAMSAFAVSAAQAEEVLRAGGYIATLKGTASNVGENFHTEAGKVTCGTSHYEGTMTEDSSTVTVHPTYTNCQAFGFVEATVNTEECNYVFHMTGHHPATKKFTASVDVSCPAGQSIKITAGTCKVEVKSQNGLTNVDITNMESPHPDDITITPTLVGGANTGDGPIAYTVTQDGFLCPFSGTGAKTGGEYSCPEGAITVEAFVKPGGVAQKTTLTAVTRNT